MFVLSGKTVYSGIAKGPIHVLNRDINTIKREKITDIELELERLDAALVSAKLQLMELYEKAVKEVGESNASIFMAYQMILEDESFLDSIRNIIHIENTNAEYAVAVTCDNFVEIFTSMDDEYMKARAADIRDVSNQLILNLSGKETINLNPEKPSIIVADDLTPSETVRMDKDKILAFVTVRGSSNSHTAILARMMNIPALVKVSVDFSRLKNGMPAVVDGYSGSVFIEPTPEIWEQADLKKCEEDERRQLLLSLKGKENLTLDGHAIDIFANIGSIGEIGHVLENDAGGIGLFRSEFLYLERDTLPTEEEQFQIYKRILQMMAGKKVVIRTVDLGSDKLIDYLKWDYEINPALGFRGIRFCFLHPEIFRTQLRALFRAAFYGNLSIMYPMITDTEEVIRIKNIVSEICDELQREGLPYKIPEQGIMIETPAAVMISDELAELVDFFSVGTNDLTQYSLAVDRQNENMDSMYNHHHKAIIRMIKMVVDSAHRVGKWVGICGELGADTALTETFIRMGVDELSVAPSMVLKIRKIVREINLV